MTFSDGRFLISGWPTGTLVSEDGLTWETHSESLVSPDCSVGTLLFYSTGQGQMYRSSDGITYEQTRENDKDTSNPTFNRCAVAGW